MQKVKSLIVKKFTNTAIQKAMKKVRNAHPLIRVFYQGIGQGKSFQEIDLELNNLKGGEIKC